MDSKEIYKNQMQARLEVLKDPDFMEGIVRGMTNFKHALCLQKDDSGKETGYMSRNKVDQIFNIMFPYVLQALLDIQVDFLPNNIVENLAQDVRELKNELKVKSEE